jgi:hypothetical protein
MVVKRLSTTVTSIAKPQTKMRTAQVMEILSPAVSEQDVSTGWQVRLDFGGGEVRNAGIASSYNPVPGDIVAVASYLNTLFVIDKVTAGASGEAPTSRVAYAWVQSTGTYATAASATEVALPGLAVTVPMRNGAAYNVRLRTGFSVTTAGQFAFFRLRQNSATSGIDLGEYFRTAGSVASLAHGFDNTLVIRNDTGLDLDVPVVPTLTGPTTGSSSAFCTAQSRAYVEVTVIGASSLYPYAAAVSAPANLT